MEKKISGRNWKIAAAENLKNKNSKCWKRSSTTVEGETGLTFQIKDLSH